MRNVLVTGGAGFIGSNFVRHLLRAREELTVVNFDKLTYAGNPESLTDVMESPRHIFLRKDITDQESVAEAFRAHQIDAVVHFAAESHVDRSILGSSVFVRTNIVGTHVLLEEARKSGVERFIVVSTDEVYGSLGAEGKFTESTPLHPNSPYAASKAAADLLALSYFHTHQVPVVITRCSNNYGPYQFPEKLIPLMIINAINNKPLPVYGDGLNVRDWLYVEDHCIAIEQVLFRGRAGEVYNIGGSNEWTNIEIVKRILKGLGKSEDLIAFVKDRPGHDRRYAMDAEKISSELGWKPTRSFDQGLEATLAWYRENTAWWKHVMTGEYQEYYRVMYENR